MKTHDTAHEGWDGIVDDDELIYPLRVAAYFAVLALFFLLVGCGATVPTTHAVPTAVPEPCKAEVPAVPVSPTKTLKASLANCAKTENTDKCKDEFMFNFTKAALAEIELLTGYSKELRANLISCVRKEPE